VLTAAAGLASACARYAVVNHAVSPATAAARPFDASRPLTSAEQHWTDSVLATLSLRERVGQMV